MNRREARSVVSPLVIACGLLLLLGLGVLGERSAALSSLRRAVRRTDIAVPERSILPLREIQRGLPIIAITMSKQDLLSPRRGILANRLERGRTWERGAHVSYFDRGTLLFAGGAGIRIHGGGSRQRPEPQSFRLYFRRQYGVTQFGPNLIFDTSAQPVKRLVLHSDTRRHGGREWHFQNPLAYDIARRIGCLTVETRPALLFLNGELQGAYVISEWIHPRFFISHFGHDRFSNDEVTLSHLEKWLERTRPLTMQRVARMVDIENLTRWFISVLFCDTLDAFQSPSQFHDDTKPMGGWIWINWDMDGSFQRPGADTFQLLLERLGEAPRGRRISEPRSQIMTTLLAEDPAYREYFMKILDEVLNYRLTDTFIRERVSFYERRAGELGITEIQYVTIEREFFAGRRALIRSLAEQYLNTDPSPDVSITGPTQARITVDGFEVGSSFSGQFFPARQITIEARVGDRSVWQWRVNGQPIVGGPGLDLNVAGTLNVEALY